MIEIKQLIHRMGVFSLNNINVFLNDKEYLVILGPTGAGKTVLLECIAGLHHVKHGQILVDGRDITRLAPEERGIGYVPQDYVLFPFLNVKDNILFGLKGKRISPTDIQQRLNSLTGLLGISHIIDRDVRSLSGGEKQRVAIARALAPEPRILLLDEPMSNLDLQTSKHLRLELKHIHRNLGVTTFHVTHNQTEAEEMADSIAILSSGKLEQVGSPDEIFFSPSNETVSQFIGALNILKCDKCRNLSTGLVEVECNGMSIILPHDEGPVEKIAIFPRDIYLSDVPPPGPSVNRFKGIITSVRYFDSTVRLEVQVGQNSLKVETANDIFEEMNLENGKDVYLILKLRRLKILDRKKDQ
ncbi:MAG: ABC transporter ATP-binding protein [Dehalococcoidales bacterium]|nr:ABC transporter ATP-binding protein [Dehalococcoidales bacterium]